MDVLARPDLLDIAGVRIDGGLDLVVVVHGPLDPGAATLGALRAKVGGYLRAATSGASPSLRERFGCAPDAPMAIILRCPHPVSDEAASVIEELRRECLVHDIILTIDRRPRALDGATGDVIAPLPSGSLDE
jgi:hypothetical protein